MVIGWFYVLALKWVNGQGVSFIIINNTIICFHSTIVYSNLILSYAVVGSLLYICVFCTTVGIGDHIRSEKVQFKNRILCSPLGNSIRDFGFWHCHINIDRKKPWLLHSSQRGKKHSISLYAISASLPHGPYTVWSLSNLCSFKSFLYSPSSILSCWFIFAFGNANSISLSLHGVEIYRCTDEREICL